MPQYVYLKDDQLPFPRGELVRDSSTGRAGRLGGVAVLFTREGTERQRIAYLQPPEGGREWEVPLEAVEAVDRP